MDKDHTDLSLLHDLVEPEVVPWWPLAPGWYVVAAVVVIILGIFILKLWKNWQANAYRRAALQELSSAGNAQEIAVVLRRCALAMAPREEIATLDGHQWIEWLDQHAPTKPSQETGKLLIEAPYRSFSESAQLEPLREYVANWIHHHRSAES